MPFSFRGWLSGVLLKREKERLAVLTRETLSDYRMVPYLDSARNNELLGLLSEVDPHMVSFVLQQLEYVALGSDPSATEGFRRDVVAKSRSLYLTNPVVSFAVDLWTDYAGSVPNLTFQEEGLQGIWDEFFTANRNEPILGARELHRLSEDQLVDGELFFVVFASTLDGACTIRTIEPDEIKEILYDPEDKKVPLFYRRDFVDQEGSLSSMYYPDWRAEEPQLARAALPPDSIRADKTRNDSLSSSAGTDVVMLHAAYRMVKNRGWPLITSSLRWVSVHDGFVADRAAVSKAAATWVEQLKAKNVGKRGIDQLKAQLGTSLDRTGGGGSMYETNPPPVAGSTWVGNNLEREWLNRPTNAGDAEKDGMAILSQLGLGLKLYPHWLGRGDYYRLATATAMEGPTLKGFSRYQAFWKSVWSDVAFVVLRFKSKYSPGFSMPKDLAIEVNSELILSTAPEQIRSAVEDLNDAFDRGVISADEASLAYRALLRTALSGLSIQGVDEMFRNETTEEGDFGEAGRPGIGQFTTAIRAAFRGLWSGVTSKPEFVEQMQLVLESGSYNAWLEGFEKGGISKSDMVQEDETNRASFVLEQASYLAGLADFIAERNRESGSRLGALSWKIDQWVNVYNKAVSEAFMLAKGDPLCTWTYGPTDHCEDCLWANGKTYRKSTWDRNGWKPQSAKLACHGINCECSLDPAAPGTKGTRGRPRRLE